MENIFEAALNRIRSEYNEIQEQKQIKLKRL